MTRFTKLTAVAATWLAALTLLLAAPAPAFAEDCVSKDIQCMIEKGGSTECLHEYIRCLSGAILDY